ncbi:MAG: hypothetical protein KTR18_10280 [Acidiferrobacterales bacterium]|nr:hypothetical protein [Acidiferrobacterales bacterium]
MLNTISRFYTNRSLPAGAVSLKDPQQDPNLREQIAKHLEVLHYRNSQLRNATIAKSEEYVARRRRQYAAVLESYVKLLKTEVHEPIVEKLAFHGNEKYVNFRKKTFAGYEAMIDHCNLSVEEILKRGAQYSRELFEIELRIKKYQKLEEEFLYPLLEDRKLIRLADNKAEFFGG